MDKDLAAKAYIKTLLTAFISKKLNFCTKALMDCPLHLNTIVNHISLQCYRTNLFVKIKFLSIEPMHNINIICWNSLVSIYFEYYHRLHHSQERLIKN